MIEALLVWVGVLALVGAGAAGVSLWMHRKAGSGHDLVSRVHALELDLNELYDRVDHWQRRDRTRRLRGQGGEDLVLPVPPQPQRGDAEYKTFLRSKLLGGKVS